MESGPVVDRRTTVQIDRILCPVDFSEISAKAYRYAQSIACHYHAQMISQHVVELWQYPELDFAVRAEHYYQSRQALMSKAQAELRLFVATHGGVQPERVVQEGRAADAILSLAQARAVSLIVMGTHGRSGFDHLMFGSVTERVLRHAPCPVLAIPPKAPDESGANVAVDPARVQRILCGVDFSAHSQRALEYALSVADAYHAEVAVLHVLENVPESANVAVETTAAMENLRKLLPPAGDGSPKPDLEVRLGKAYRGILDFAAERQSNLIIVGTRGRNSLDQQVFGSTAYRVIQLYPGPVLTVPI